MHYHRFIACFAGASLLGGCAGMSVAPQPILPVKYYVDAVKIYDTAAISAAFSTAGGANNTREYRNRVALAYLAAIDARYREFKTNLSSESRGIDVGFDIAALGLSGLGALVERSASDLAIVSGVFAGTRGSINKNVYFDRTVTAVIASMDATRLRLRTQINQRMQLSLSEYPIEGLMSDLEAYQSAGSIDEGVASVVDQAATDRSKARAAYLQSLGLSCDVQEAIVPLRTRLDGYLRKTYYASVDTAATATSKGQARLRLNRMATIFNVSTSGTSDDVLYRMLDEIELKWCSAKELEQKISDIEADNAETM